MIDVIIILTTTGTKKDSEDISRTLLEERLVACSQIMPIQSMYWWKDKIRKKRECLCLFKTKDYKPPMTLMLIPKGGFISPHEQGVPI